MIRTSSWLVLLLLLAAGCSFSSQFNAVSGEADLLLLPRSHCVAEALADGTVIHLAVDTGASLTAFSQWWAEEHDAATRPTDAIPVIGMRGESIELDQRILIDELAIGGATFRDLAIFLLPTAGFDMRPTSVGRQDFQGLLGWDLMGEFILVHEDEPRRIRLIEKSKLPAELSRFGSVDDWESVPLQWFAGVPHIKIEIPRSQPVVCTLDTGSDVTILPPSAVEALGSSASRGKVRYAAVGGEFEVTLHKVENLEFLSWSVSGVISVAETEDPILGYDILRKLTFMIDRDNARLYVLKPPSLRGEETSVTPAKKG